MVLARGLAWLIVPGSRNGVNVGPFHRGAVAQTCAGENADGEKGAQFVAYVGVAVAKDVYDLVSWYRRGGIEDGGDGGELVEGEVFVVNLVDGGGDGADTFPRIDGELCVGVPP